jgi:adenylate cyclase
MATDRVKRKLSAILSADVEGYSRLMGEDEAATVQTITAYRETMSQLIQQYRGRVVDSPGDNLLAEFASVVDAVQCAVEVQEVLKLKNADLPEDRRMQFRIGINLGDVIEEGDRIYGDGVNIAARIEGLAEGGGICISGSAYEQIENKLALGYEYLGEHTVKNISKPIRVYRVLTESDAIRKVIDETRVSTRNWRRIAIAAVIVLIVIGGGLVGLNVYLRQSMRVEAASLDKMAYPLPGKPSIAVLPFDNLSGDPEQEYFSDGLTEQIITSLSRIPRMFVIARNSTFTYKGKPVKVQKVAEDLGVRYILEGGVQRSGGRVRITAQLIDAIAGYHIWAERYDRQMEDIFALQDEITMKILTALQVELTEGEQIMWARDYPGSLDAYEKHIKAIYYMRRGTKQDNEQARRLLREVIELDTEYADYAAACMLSGWTNFFDVKFGWSKDPEKSIKIAFECAKMCIADDRGMENGHFLLGAVYHLQGKYEEAISEVERAIALGSNAADHYSLLGEITSCAGRWEEGIPILKKAIRLNPFPPVYYFSSLGRSYMMTGRYEEAIKTYNKSLSVNPNFLPARLGLTATYILSDKAAEAEVAATEVLSIDPKFSLEHEHFAKTRPYKNKADIDHYVAALRKAGLK